MDDDFRNYVHHSMNSSDCNCISDQIIVEPVEIVAVLNLMMNK